MLDPLGQAKPEVPAKPTRPQNTTKNCLSFTHKAKDHCACSLSHERGEAHPAQSSQGASYRSYNEGQGRPLTRKTNLVNDAISLRLPSSSYGARLTSACSYVAGVEVFNYERTNVDSLDEGMLAKLPKSSQQSTPEAQHQLESLLKACAGRRSNLRLAVTRTTCGRITWVRM